MSAADALAASVQVQNEGEFARLTRLSGRHCVPAMDCSYPPSVEAHDVLDVDFDCHGVTTDGLYLVETIEGGRGVWRGCRRFSVRPAGLNMDASGHGEWTASLPVGLRVVGRVRQIYEPKAANR